mmetsp:Transcript_1104/g.3553  ORF Transcript_1104/g.3553 Transcript_1104/m.3553 type:complete len:311 (-) Transcript_1104:3-935(-)
MASTSSMNSKLGAAAIAAWNNCRIFASDSPDMPDTISVAATLKKGTPVVPAMACASFVFPEPGGPWSRTPVGGCTPRWSKTSGWARGWTMSCRRSASTESTPPRSSRRSCGRSSGEKPAAPCGSDRPASRRAAAMALRSRARLAAPACRAWRAAAASALPGGPWWYIRRSDPLRVSGGAAPSDGPAESCAVAAAPEALGAGSCNWPASLAEVFCFFLLWSWDCALPGAFSAGTSPSPDGVGSGELSSCAIKRFKGCCLARLYSGYRRTSSSRTVSLSHLRPSEANFWRRSRTRCGRRLSMRSTHKRAALP